MISKFKKGLIFFGDFLVPIIVIMVMELYYNNSNMKPPLVIISIILLIIILTISLLGFICLLYLINQGTKLGYEKREIYMINDTTKSDLTFYLSFWLIIIGFYLISIYISSTIYMIMGFIIGILLSMNEDIYSIIYNPILYLIGYRNYQVNVKNDDHEIYIISNKKLENGAYKLYLITDYLFYYDKRLIEREVMKND
jgi:hypothetical protein